MRIIGVKHVTNDGIIVLAFDPDVLVELVEV
jgi:hypothetical protein